MHLARRRIMVAGVVGFLMLGGVAFGALSLSAARRDARSSVALIAHALPRTTGYRVRGCTRVHGGQVRCSYQLSIRALSGGTITCTSEVQVRTALTKIRQGQRTVRRLMPVSSFPTKPKCVRRVG